MSDPRNPATVANETNERVFNTGAASLAGTPGDGHAFDVLRYPTANLGADEYPHYVMFFISERRSSIDKAEVGSTFIDPASLNFDYSQNNAGVDKSNAASKGYNVIAGAVGGAVLGNMLGNYKGNLVSGGAAKTLGGAGAIVGAGRGAAVGAGISAIQGDRTQVLLKTAIALYLPHKPTANYTAEWMSEDLGIVGGISQQIRAVSNADGFMDTMKALVSGGGGAFQSAVLQGASRFDTGGLGNIGSAQQASGGFVANPFKAQLFKGMGFRQFAFEYSFLPKNPDEYEEVKRIIKTFKLYMHPTLGLDKFIMDYPAEFTLAFYHKDKLNKELFKVSNCALTNMSVDYGGTDFVTFRSKPGAPTEISVKLQFTELEIMTRQRVEVGY